MSEDTRTPESGRPIWKSVGALLALVVTALAGLGLISGEIPPRELQRLIEPTRNQGERALAAFPGLGALSVAGDAFGASTWYFAHGYSSNAGADTHHTWFLLANPGGTDAQATITLRMDNGEVKTITTTVPAQDRAAIYANSHATGSFSAIVSSTVPLVAEESLFFANDGYTVPGVGTPSTIWYLPEGSNGSRYDTRLHIYNPSETAASLTITFFDEAGATEDITKQVPPRSALRFTLAQECRLQGSVATRIVSSLPVVVQRVTYFPGRDGGRGGHATGGSSLLSNTHYFPLVLADANFDTWLMLLNPGDTALSVEANYVQAGGTRGHTYTLPPHSRATIWLDKEVAEGRAPEGAFGVALASDAPFAAESVTYDSGYLTGSASPGAPGAARRWHFAEGSTSVPYTTYLAIFNPGSTGAIVTASFVPSAPGTPSPSWALLPGEVKVVNLNDVAKDLNAGFSLSSDVPVVASRLMTMTGSGLLGAVGLPEDPPPVHPVAYLPILIRPPELLVTPSPSPSPTPSAAVTPTRVYRAEGTAFAITGPIVGSANCGTTGVKGRVLDAAGQPLAGARVRVWAEGWAGGLSNPTDPEGRWDFVLGTGARAGTWYAAVADDAGELLSPAVALPTSDNCSNGYQWLEVNWSERTAAAPAYVLAWSRRLSCEENNGNHHLFIDVTDGQGNGLPGVTLRVTWSGGQSDIATGNKLDVGPGRVEFPMYKGTYTVQVLSGSSETARELTVDLPDDTVCDNHGNTLYHYSYHVVFRKP